MSEAPCGDEPELRESLAPLRSIKLYLPACPSLPTLHVDRHDVHTMLSISVPDD
jgi:hypothetical protein